VRTYKAITAISNRIIEDGLCDAIILKGSIGRGDDDEFSDVDMYLVVSSENMDVVMCKRSEYLSAYKDIVYFEDVNFARVDSHEHCLPSMFQHTATMQSGYRRALLATDVCI